ncbi:MAG: homocysteine S-methyltransferase [Chlorobi bacterium]|nr:homocysteine S-methyltransferase [Chlorobiota bacterium]
MNPTISQRLQTGPIVIDGSMEAVLRSRGHNESPVEIYNLTNPALIERIHDEFIEAGAEIIQSNTRCANGITLNPFKLKERVYEINRKGVWLARTAAVNRAYVAGTVGPIGKFLTPIGKLRPEDAREAFMTQIHALLDGNVDLLLLKSFIDIDELEIALEVARHISRDIPIIAQRTFPEDSTVLSTDFPREVARRLNLPGVIAIGSNGTVGPNRMLTIVRSLYGTTNAILSAQPDIGIPTLVDGQPIYNATIEYVAGSVRALVEQGVTIIGVDGGGMPEHVRAIRQAIDGMAVGTPEVKVKKMKAPLNDEAEEQTAPSRFLENLGKRFLVTAELDIPRGLDMTEVFEGAEYLKRHGIDAVNISDGARARLRMSSITISHLITQRTGMECITHLACRDRNMVGLQSELLGAHALGVRNILAVTGDPAQIGDYPYATSVYDVDAIGLIRALKRMNAGLDLMGNPVGKRTNFLIACACNPVADDMDREISRLERKVAEGAQVAFTQPLFEAASLRRFLDRTEHLPIRIMLGVIPLRTARHAEFLHHEVPGMKIPEAIQRRMRESANATAEGVSIAVDFLESTADVRDRIVGLYIMPPLRRNDMIVEILEKAGLHREVTA